MTPLKPIMIVDDDLDDQDMIREMLKEIGVKNTLFFFDNAPAAFQELKDHKEQYFIILSDINMPGQNGIEFKRQIDEDPELRARSIPFVFLTTSAEKTAIDETFKKMTVQGFFEKSPSFEEQKGLLKLIIEYWTYCKHPNSQ
jgi:CheY-like chemotaxis protein